MADSIVVADNVELVANNIQSKVGATLLGTRALAEDTVQGSNSVQTLLTEITIFQSSMVAKLSDIWETLKSQLDLDKEAERKKREQAKEIALEGQRKKKKTKGGLKDLAEDDDGSGFNLKTMMATVGTTLLTVGGLKMFAGKLFKGGIWALLGVAAGNALVNMFNVQSPAAADAIKTTLPTVAAMLAMFKLKTALLVALPVVSAFGIASIASWLTGKKMAREVTGFDWGTAALTGPALAIFLKYGLGMKFGATLGGLVFGWPLIVAGSLAIALAVGAGYLANKVDKVEDTMLEHMKETTNLSQEEFEKRLIKDRATKLANYSIWMQSLFDENALNMAQQNTSAVKGAQNEYKTTGKLSTGSKSSMLGLVDLYTNMDEDAIQALLMDKNRLDDVNDWKIEMMKLAELGALGDDKEAVMKKLALMEENIQEGAIKKMADLSSKGLKVEAHISQTADATSGGYYGNKANLFEKYMTSLEPHFRPRLDLIKKKESDKEYLALRELYNDKDRMSIMSEPEQEKYLAMQKEIDDLKRTPTIGRINMPNQIRSSAATVGLLKFLMSLDDNQRTVLDKIVLKSQLVQDKDKKAENIIISDNKKVLNDSKSSNVLAPIVAYPHSLGTTEEAALQVFGVSNR
jgi:hypothetical protein